MKKQQHRILIILCCCFSLKATTQNLVFNPSFEDTISCPNSSGQIDRAKGWFLPTPPPMNTPDYFNDCSSSLSTNSNPYGGQSAVTGNAFAAIATYDFNSDGVYREYIECALLDSLMGGNNYCVSFYVSLVDLAQYNCNNMGVYFSTDSIYSTDTILPFTAQIQNNLSNSLADKNNWTLISGSFVASGSEKYLILGNFDIPLDLDTAYVGGHPFVNGAYYYIDDISVEEVKPANAGNDTTIISADSVQIGDNPTENANYFWQPATGLSDTNAANPMVWTANTTTYIVTKTQCSVVTTDTVTVYNTVGINEFSYEYKIRLYPNPNNGKMTLDYSLQPNDKGEILFYDITGKLVASYVLDNKDNKLAIINEQLNDGFYTYRIVVNNAVVKSEKLIIRK